MVEALTRQELSIQEVRRFMHSLGMKPLKTGHVPAKADALIQQQFVAQQLGPLVEKAQAGQYHLFFMDAAHFMLAPFVGLIWCFARMFVKAAPGRNRINVLGVLYVVTRKMETVINTTYINADTVVELLENVAAKFNDLPIYLVLDNALNQHCNYVKQMAESLNITLVFLPPAVINM